MAQHLKSKSTGGFYQADASPCTISYLWLRPGRRGAPGRVRLGRPSPVVAPSAVAAARRASEWRALHLLVELLEDVLALEQRVQLQLVARVGDDLGSRRSVMMCAMFSQRYLVSLV